ncbi:MAG: hypothetical protein BMS9Abin28_0468 [Anaerolineae bacterium]|nr:MAG: hypothetical protein BMS9Abin28_0468 [Anaerolineae bacterium]
MSRIPRGVILSNIILVLLLSLAMSACRQSVVPVPTPTSPEGEESEPPPTDVPVTEAQPTSIIMAQVKYAVAWVHEDEPLTVRQPAGITSMAVASLASDQRGLTATGKTTQMGSSTWVEIDLPAGGKGWINGWNLTEDVPGSSFCEDARISDLANRFIVAVRERDGGTLADLISPKRGLTIRHDWWNPEVNFGFSSVSGLFLDPTPTTWGVNRDSELTIDGTFREVILPQLEDVFSIAPELNCNKLGAGSTAQDAIWPSEYSNMNYISFYRAAPEPGSQLNWRTWALGIEYLEGQPYIALLVQYRGEI